MTPTREDGAGFRECFYTSQDGLRLYFRDYGDPLSPLTPVLCLGGLTRNSKDFHRLARRLAGTRRVLAPDYRGRGRSAYDPDWRNYQPRTYVDDVRHLLAATNVHRVAAIGTSLGGVLAMALAVAAPTKLAAAVLNDIGAEIDFGDLAPVVAHMRDARPLADWEEAARRLQTLFPDLPARTADDWLAIARATYRACDDGLLRRDWDPALVEPLLRGKQSRADLWHLFGALGRLPVLMVRGARSRILPPELFERMARRMPDAARVVVADVGHAPNLSEPEVLRGIDELLAKADAARPAAQ
jgi:pimeloyl-ACP methyl ester carboxylesterase